MAVHGTSHAEFVTNEQHISYLRALRIKKMQELGKLEVEIARITFELDKCRGVR